MQATSLMQRYLPAKMDPVVSPYNKKFNQDTFNATYCKLGEHLSKEELNKYIQWKNVKKSGGDGEKATQINVTLNY